MTSPKQREGGMDFCDKVNEDAIHYAIKTKLVPSAETVEYHMLKWYFYKSLKIKIMPIV